MWLNIWDIGKYDAWRTLIDFAESRVNNHNDSKETSIGS